MARWRIRIAALLALSLALAAAGCGGNAPADNPYGKRNLHPATIELLDDPHYQNLILPRQLAEKLRNKEEVYVYFFSPLCPHCIETTPVVQPIAQEMGIDMKMYNVLEFEQGWRDHGIEGTPTLVHYVDGAEVSRIEGSAPAEDFRAWFRAEMERRAGQAQPAG